MWREVRMSATDTLIIEELRLEARKLKQQAEKALAQVNEDGFFARIDPDANSLAVLVKHLGNNLRSRWTDFYTTDGEKPDRHRDVEFELGPGDTRDSLMARWEAGWARFIDTFDAMTPADLERTVMIRWEPHSVPRAVLRGLTHAAGHVGQIVLLARHIQGAEWRTLSIPRGESEAFNAKLREHFAPRGGSGASGA
jgi:Protein of unknown function (DUF1572)